MNLKFFTELFPTYNRFKRDLDGVFNKLKSEDQKDWLEVQHSLSSYDGSLLFFGIGLVLTLTLNISELSYKDNYLIFTCLLLYLLFAFINLILKLKFIDKYTDEKYIEMSSLKK